MSLIFMTACGGDDSPTGNNGGSDGNGNSGGSGSAPTTGTLEVTSSTTGDDQDTDGYTVTVDGQGQDIGINETISIADLDEGSYDAELSGIASNCSLSGDNPQSVDVTAGETSSVTFDVSCQAKSQGKIVFQSDRDGDNDIYSMDPDGSHVKNITDDSYDDVMPAVSPDGTQIAFLSERNSSYGIYVVNSDGNNSTKIVDSSNSCISDISVISWSPDGSQMAIKCGYDVLITSNDGKNRHKLDINIGDISWAPNGNKIALAGEYQSMLSTINSDGTGKKSIDVSELSNIKNFGTIRSIDYSNDGTKFVFNIGFSSPRGQYHNYNDIFTMNTDGSNLVRVTDSKEISNPKAREGSVKWSPDDTKLIYHKRIQPNQSSIIRANIYMVNADGSNSPKEITDNIDKDKEPVWTSGLN